MEGAAPETTPAPDREVIATDGNIKRWIEPWYGAYAILGALASGLAVIAIPLVVTGGGGGATEIGTAIAAQNICALFAPVFAAIDDGLRAELERADVVFLDGSFYRDDELEALGLGDKRATALGHLPVGGEGGSLKAAAALGGRRIFTHLNNSNPMLDPASPEALAWARQGDTP